MIPRPLSRPPIQEARSAAGPAAPTSGPQVHAALAPMPPTPSRLEQRRVVLDQWGRATLEGLHGDRLAEPARESGASPLILAGLGYLAAKIFGL